MFSILNKIKKAIEFIVCVFLVLMTIIIFYQVVVRFGFNYTPPWVQPLSLMLMVWIGFIGIAIGIVDNSHIRVNLIVEKFPEKIQKVIVFFQRILALLFGIFMLFEGYKFSGEMQNSMISGLNVSSAMLYVSMPVAGVIVVVYIIIELVSKKNKRPTPLKKVT
ncbi:TRAP transporter small permease [Oceanobacillus sp. M60]|uniref:TRAP transporter small permease n=1 Tax=Oceanobacillus oncorhynchi TaxID=545501 RepID=UPI001866A024|nr:TRAP transporter small permease [Oceanobacillus oncorhynchi]